jgi:hypothetical protein
MPQARIDHFRAFARFPSNLPVWVTPLAGAVERPVRLVNVGLGGLCFESAQSFELGTSLRVELELPGLWDRLPLECEVAWTAPGAEGTTRAGVRYARPTGRALRILAENIG